MKILIATDTYKPSINGVVTSVINLEKGLKNLGHEVKIVTLSQTLYSYARGDIYYIGSIDIGKIYPDVRMKSAVARKEINKLMNWHPDIIHTQSEFSTFRIAKKISKKLHIPIVHTYHTKYEDYTHYLTNNINIGKKIATFITFHISENIKALIAPTFKIYTMLKEYGVDCPIEIIPTGISIKKYKKIIPLSEIKEIKKNLQIPDNNLILVSISRIGKEKNIAELIYYMKKLEYDNISFVIVGDGPERHNLANLVDSLNLEDKIKFTGMVSPTQIPIYYQLADLFVSASTSETQGLTYIEALASGTPILCKEDECLNNLMIEGLTGYSFKNEKEFNIKLEQFIDNNNKEEMSKATKKIADNYNIDTFVKNVEQFYYSYIKKSNN
ncbi:hypothetical protein AN641_03035 [Candidatus Epulonipiscioides gigas]|nr:hypothetical protein AN641_03035 [Epulopiscium sp. SCG-C07WGA-EpuloA2]